MGTKMELWKQPGLKATPHEGMNALAFKKDKEYRIGNTHPITPQSFSLLLVG